MSWQRIYEHWKELSAGMLFALAALFFLILFVCIEIYGSIAFWEPNTKIRRIEIAVMVFVFGLASERLVRDFLKFLKESE